MSNILPKVNTTQSETLNRVSNILPNIYIYIYIYNRYDSKYIQILCAAARGEEYGCERLDKAASATKHFVVIIVITIISSSSDIINNHNDSNKQTNIKPTIRIIMIIIIITIHTTNK